METREIHGDWKTGMGSEGDWRRMGQVKAGEGGRTLLGADDVGGARHAGLRHGLRGAPPVHHRGQIPHLPPPIRNPCCQEGQ